MSPSGASPEVSILMPVLNGASVVGRAIESVLGQTFANFQLVVVNDGSSDETEEILQSYVALDDRVRVVRNEVNLGLVYSLNRGLATSGAPLVARLDADDSAMPERLALQIKAFADPKVVLSATGYERIAVDTKEVRTSTPPINHGALAVAMTSANRLCHSSVMFRAEAVRMVGGYDPLWYPVEDYDLWLRLMAVGLYTGIDRPLVRYFENADGISGGNAVRQQTLFAERVAKYRSTLGCSAGLDVTTPRDISRMRHRISANLAERGVPDTGTRQEAYRMAMASASGSRIRRHVATAIGAPLTWASRFGRHD